MLLGTQPSACEVHKPCFISKQDKKLCLSYPKYVRGGEKFSVANLVGCEVEGTVGKCNFKYLSSFFQNRSPYK